MPNYILNKYFFLIQLEIDMCYLMEFERLIYFIYTISSFEELIDVINC